MNYKPVACAIFGLLVGLAVWWVSRPPESEHHISPAPKAESTTVLPPAGVPTSIPLPPREASRSAPPTLDAAAETKIANRKDPGSPSLTLSPRAQRMFTAAVGAPHQFTWSDAATSEFLNPDGKPVDARLYSGLESELGRLKLLAESTGIEANSTMNEELAQLQRAGVAVTLKQGESPWVKVGKDAVFSMQLGTGAGIAAKKSDMPRYLEVEARLQRIGQDMMVTAAGYMHREGYFDSKHHEAILRQLGR